MIPVFGRSVPELSLISNHMLGFMYNAHKHLLQDFNQTWLSPQQLEWYAAAISDKGSPLEHCCDFIDGTVTSVCLQEANRKFQSIKFQSIAARNGVIAILHSPEEGRRHSGMLAMSSLILQLQLNARTSNVNLLCIYSRVPNNRLHDY